MYDINELWKRSNPDYFHSFNKCVITPYVKCGCHGDKLKLGNAILFKGNVHHRRATLSFTMCQNSLSVFQHTRVYSNENQTNRSSRKNNVKGLITHHPVLTRWILKNIPRQRAKKAKRFFHFEAFLTETRLYFWTVSFFLFSQCV